MSESGVFDNFQGSISENTNSNQSATKEERNNLQNTVLLLDATETPVNRPKNKGIKKNLLQKNKNDTTKLFRNKEFL